MGMTENNDLSLRNEVFRDMVDRLDGVLESTVERMKRIGAHECEVGLKIRFEIVGEDDVGRDKPVIEYKISTCIPLKGSVKLQVNGAIVLEEPEDETGYKLRNLAQQTSLL